MLFWWGLDIAVPATNRSGVLADTNVVCVISEKIRICSVMCAYAQDSCLCFEDGGICREHRGTTAKLVVCTKITLFVSHSARESP